MYDKIVNPATGKLVNVNGPIGQHILRKYASKYNNTSGISQRGGGNVYDKIQSPLTDKWVNVDGKLGQSLLKSYVNQLGGGGKGIYYAKNDRGKWTATKVDRREGEWQADLDNLCGAPASDKVDVPVHPDVEKVEAGDEDAEDADDDDSGAADAAAAAGADGDSATAADSSAATVKLTVEGLTEGGDGDILKIFKVLSINKNNDLSYYFQNGKWGIAIKGNLSEAHQTNRLADHNKKNIKKIKEGESKNAPHKVQLKMYHIGDGKVSGVACDYGNESGTSEMRDRLTEDGLWWPLEHSSEDEKKLIADWDTWATNSGGKYADWKKYPAIDVGGLTNATVKDLDSSTWVKVSDLVEEGEGTTVDDKVEAIYNLWNDKFKSRVEEFAKHHWAKQTKWKEKVMEAIKSIFKAFKDDAYLQINIYQPVGTRLGKFAHTRLIVKNADLWEHGYPTDKPITYWGGNKYNYSDLEQDDTKYSHTSMYWHAGDRKWAFVSNINPANIALEYTLFRTGGTPVLMPTNTDSAVWDHIQTNVIGNPDEDRLLTEKTESDSLGK